MPDGVPTDEVLKHCVACRFEVKVGEPAAIMVVAGYIEPNADGDAETLEGELPDVGLLMHVACLESFIDQIGLDKPSVPTIHG